MKLYEVIDISDAVPYDKITGIRKLIKKGAFDAELIWTSALELVHAAYRTENVNRPTPSMKNAWDQYEDNIQFAVTQLQDATSKFVRDDTWKSVASRLSK